MDLVESVRLMAANEVAVIDHWRGFVRHALGDVLPRHGGRMVKSLGDGIMAEFDSARQAVGTALQLHRYFDAANAGQRADQYLCLRAGLNATHVYVDDIDIYGSGVNLASRVASLAGPGETMATESVRDGLADGLDAQVEDMGECHLKHVAQPVRAYRIGPVGSQPILVPQQAYAGQLQPTIAVIPFAARSQEAEQFSVGDLIADGVIAQLGRSSALRVISLLSARALLAQPDTVQAAGQRLNADYVLNGSYLASGSSHSSKLMLTASLLQLPRQEVVWVDRFDVPLADLCAADSEACQRIVSGLHQTLFDKAASSATRQPPPTLDGYALMLGGIALMHRSRVADMKMSQRLLGHLADRHPRATDVHAWLAKSFVLNAVSSFASTSEDARRAEALCREVLSRGPENALSLAVQAHVLTHFGSDAAQALAKVEAALLVSQNEPLAWLFKSVLSAMWGDPACAVAEAQRARALSPADPLNYYFKMIEASAHTVAGDYAQGQRLARDSIRLNRFHPPTWRVLITAQVHGGDMASARQSLQTLLELDPGFRLSAYLRAGNAGSNTKQQFVLAARELGLQE